MKKKPKISIIIRTKNEERWIESCLEKIFSQKNKNFEVILVDNFSSDKTIQKAKRYPIKLRKIKKFLPGKAINDGIKISKGEIIVCLSAHCIPINDNWLEKLIRPLKNKKIAGVYGRQEPMPYSSDFDKRDLLLLFGLDKKVQTKDPFFHNANSAFRKELWKKINFDENTTNIEDRIWGHEVIKKGYKIIYEPLASVFHFHGVHQNLDPDRCANVVSIMERTGKKYTNVYNNFEKHSNRKLKIVAILPIKGKPITYKDKYLMEYTIKHALSNKLIDEVYVTTDNKKTSVISKKLGAKSPFLRPSSLSNKAVDLLTVCQYTLKQIEKKINPDLVYIITENFPLRGEDLLDKMYNALKKKGLEMISACKRERAGVWTKKYSEKNFKKVIDGITPGDLRENETFIVPFGLGCLTFAHTLRSGNFFSKNFDFFPVNNPMNATEIRDKNSLKQFVNIIENKN
tara:strand:+ start:6379 stop:7749 length:1371 start_codon:yes stop_codon:yes gene_type:complete